MNAEPHGPTAHAVGYTDVAAPRLKRKNGRSHSAQPEGEATILTLAFRLSLISIPRPAGKLFALRGTIPCMNRHHGLPIRESEFFAGLRHATEFFMGMADVQRALEKLVRLLEEANVPYAIVGGLALNEYGYRRVTEDVDVLLTREGLERFKSHWLGRGYVEKFPGSRGLRDTENGVAIDVVIAGEYPGDGAPKPVAFPDPEVSARRGERVRLLPLEGLIELKLASGMSAPHRLRDLADVLEIIRVCDLQLELASRLDESVRDKYRELWNAARGAGDE